VIITDKQVVRAPMLFKKLFLV